MQRADTRSACEEQKWGPMEYAKTMTGIDHPDALYRAAGEGDCALMAGDSRPKAICPCCSRKMRRVMRVRITNEQATQSRWVALCAMCAASMLATNPRAVVGGRIRPRMRRAG